ncbi:MAG: hypothetical protein FWD74_07365 [Actinomycetia bacterium]|nr:hypothetical protein [Actinomycetes bacterium]
MTPLLDAPPQTGARPVHPLGDAVATRLRFPGPAAGRERRFPIGVVAASAQRFAAATGRPAVLRRALAVADPITPRMHTAAASVTLPRWWTPNDVPRVPAEEARALPRRGLPRAARQVPNEQTYTPGAIAESLISTEARVRRLAETAAVGSVVRDSKINAVAAATSVAAARREQQRAAQAAPPPVIHRMPASPSTAVRPSPPAAPPAPGSVHPGPPTPAPAEGGSGAGSAPTDAARPGSAPSPTGPAPAPNGPPPAAGSNAPAAATSGSGPAMSLAPSPAWRPAPPSARFATARAVVAGGTSQPSLAAGPVRRFHPAGLPTAVSAYPAPAALASAEHPVTLRRMLGAAHAISPASRVRSATLRPAGGWLGNTAGASAPVAQPAGPGRVARRTHSASAAAAPTAGPRSQPAGAPPPVAAASATAPREAAPSWRGAPPAGQSPRGPVLTGATGAGSAVGGARPGAGGGGSSGGPSDGGAAIARSMAGAPAGAGARRAGQPAGIPMATASSLTRARVDSTELRPATLIRRLPALGAGPILALPGPRGGAANVPTGAAGAPTRRTATGARPPSAAGGSAASVARPAETGASPREAGPFAVPPMPAATAATPTAPLGASAGIGSIAMPDQLILRRTARHGFTETARARSLGSGFAPDAPIRPATVSGSSAVLGGPSGGVVRRATSSSSASSIAPASGRRAGAGRPETPPRAGSPATTGGSLGAAPRLGAVFAGAPASAESDEPAMTLRRWVNSGPPRMGFRAPFRPEQAIPGIGGQHMAGRAIGAGIGLFNDALRASEGSNSPSTFSPPPTASRRSGGSTEAITFGRSIFGDEPASSKTSKTKTSTNDDDDTDDDDDDDDVTTPSRPAVSTSTGTSKSPNLDELVDSVIDRIEQRVIDELERRGRRANPGVF